MRNTLVRSVLWLHTLVASLAGLGLYLFPKTFGPLWPWTLPPLAARFMGSLFIGGAVCTALAALSPEPIPVEGPALLGIGYLLIFSVGLLDAAETRWTSGMLTWQALFIFIGLALIGLPFLHGRSESQAENGPGLPRDLRRYFKIHLAVVLPVGLTMFLLPAVGQKLWPWGLSIINVRLLGAFFVGASILSIWCLRQRSWQAVQPLVGLYAVFTTLATWASILHFSLFNPSRLVTWLFFALYLFVGIGAWFFLARAVLRRSHVIEVEMKVP